MPIFSLSKKLSHICASLKVVARPLVHTKVKRNRFIDE